jgi:polysaccharide export outer membrane protein
MIRDITLALVLAMAAATPCRAAQAPAPQASADYVIGPDDVLDIAVWNNAAITRTVPVRPDGKISLPLINDVQAAGFTPMQLRDTLKEALAAYLSAPSVSVIVREVRSFKVSVIGQVKTPGRYELKDRATVLDVLAMAGGFTDFAARGGIVVFRQEGGTTRQIPFLFDKLTTKGGSKNGGQENFCVAPGDIVLVP